MMKNRIMLSIAAGVVVILAGIVTVLSVNYVKKGGPLAVMGASLKNTIEIPLSQAESLLADYGSKNLEVYVWQEEKIVIKEYLNDDWEEAKATVEFDGNRAVVSGGKWRWSIRNMFWGGLNERMEIYLPAQGINELELVTGSGNINAMEGFSIETKKTRIQAGSGNIRWMDTGADEVILYANSGNVRGDRIRGNTNVHTGSGNITVKNVTGFLKAQAGSGNITVEGLSGGCGAEAGSGNIRVDAVEVLEDITLHTGSGNQRLGLPESLSCSFQVKTGSGNIHTDFDDLLDYNKKGNQAAGQTGGAPVCQVTCQAGSGNVTIHVR